MEKAFGYQPWEPLSLLLDLGYRFLFACPGGLVDHLPTEAMPFPKEFEMGYNVIAYHPPRDQERKEGLRRLMAGRLPGAVAIHRHRFRIA